jgi:hypothetical protein
MTWLSWQYPTFFRIDSKEEDVRCQRHSSDDGLRWTSDAYCQRIDLEDVTQQVPAQARGPVRDPAIGSGSGVHNNVNRGLTGGLRA